MSDQRPVSIRKMAALLGMGSSEAAAKSLKAMVYAREDEIGRNIAVRMRGKRRPKLKITMSAIEREFPELRRYRPPTPETQRKLMRAMVRSEVARAIAETIEPQLAELRAFVNEIGKLARERFSAESTKRPRQNRSESERIART